MKSLTITILQKNSIYDKPLLTGPFMIRERKNFTTVTDMTDAVMEWLSAKSSHIAHVSIYPIQPKNDNN